ncbi:MAG: hypothetical protein ACREFP_15235 [Acetobacteraceae bacterium]
MQKALSVALAGLLVVGCSTAALAAAQRARVRGTIESINGDTLVIKTYGGNTTKLLLGPGTKFISVVPASLSDVKSGEFVGIGATGPENNIMALEVVIFPNSLRGTGEGHYSWSVPAAVAAADRGESASLPAGAPPVQGTMTNGTITTAASAPPVQGTMTNGTVATSSAAQGGEALSVAYDHGKKVQITVPANAPVVRLVPAGRSILAAGAKTFAVATEGTAGGAAAANFVAVGKNGLMPPM